MRSVIKWLLLLVALWAAMATVKWRTLTSTNAQLTEWHNRSPGALGRRDLVVEDRDVRPHVPRSYDPEKPLPLVLAFHGRSQRHDRFYDLFRLDAWAERSGFVLAVPSGVKGDGERQWTFRGERDVEFVDAVRDRVAGEYAIDLRRIYLFGFSNGGHFAFVYAAHRPSSVAAIAANSAPWFDWVGMPSREMAVLFLHGTRDAVFPMKQVQVGMQELREAGNEVALIEMDGCRHELFTGRLDDVWNWLSAHSVEIG